MSKFIIICFLSFCIQNIIYGLSHSAIGVIRDKSAISESYLEKPITVNGGTLTQYITNAYHKPVAYTLCTNDLSNFSFYPLRKDSSYEKFTHTNYKDNHELKVYGSGDSDYINYMNKYFNIGYIGKKEERKRLILLPRESYARKAYFLRNWINTEQLNKLDFSFLRFSSITSFDIYFASHSVLEKTLPGEKIKFVKKSAYMKYPSIIFPINKDETLKAEQKTEKIEPKETKRKSIKEMIAEIEKEYAEDDELNFLFAFESKEMRILEVKIERLVENLENKLENKLYDEAKLLEDEIKKLDEEYGNEDVKWRLREDVQSKLEEHEKIKDEEDIRMLKLIRKLNINIDICFVKSLDKTYNCIDIIEEEIEEIKDEKSPKKVLLKIKLKTLEIEDKKLNEEMERLEKELEDIEEKWDKKHGVEEVVEIIEPVVCHIEKKPDITPAHPYPLELSIETPCETTSYYDKDRKLPSYKIDAEKNIKVKYLLGNIGLEPIWINQNDFVPALVSWELSSKKEKVKIDNSEVNPVSQLPHRETIPLNPGEYLAWEHIFPKEKVSIEIKSKTEYTLECKIKAKYFTNKPNKNQKKIKKQLTSKFKFITK